MFRFSNQALSAALMAVLAATLACAAPDESGDAGAGDSDPGAESSAGPSTLAQLLADGQAVFGVFSRPTAPDNAALMGQNRELDFVFYSLESGPFDIMSTKVYMDGIAEGSGEDAPHPLILRIPPIRNGVAEAEAHAAEALAAGIAGIVFPHAESAEDAAVAVSVMGDDLWPGNPAGTLLSILIVEDAEAVDRVDEIVATPGCERGLRRARRPAQGLPGRHGGGRGSDPAGAGGVPAPRGAVRNHGGRGRHRRADRAGLPGVHRERSGRGDSGQGGGGAGVAGRVTRTQPPAASMRSRARRRKRSAAATAFVACSSLKAMKGNPPGRPLG